MDLLLEINYIQQNFTDAEAHHLYDVIYNQQLSHKEQKKSFIFYYSIFISTVLLLIFLIYIKADPLLILALSILCLFTGCLAFNYKTVIRNLQISNFKTKFSYDSIKVDYIIKLYEDKIQWEIPQRKTLIIPYFTLNYIYESNSMFCIDTYFWLRKSDLNESEILSLQNILQKKLQEKYIKINL